MEYMSRYNEVYNGSEWNFKVVSKYKGQSNHIQ